MSEIDIGLLYPGEPAVFIDKVNEIVLGLEDGKSLEPISIAKIDNIFFVRDGNHRVKALIEYSSKHNNQIPKIKYTFNNHPFRNNHRDFLLHIGKEYGSGIPGFKNVFAGSEDEYNNISYNVNQAFQKEFKKQ